MGVVRGPFGYAFFETRIVRRSNMLMADLLQDGYGDEFNFQVPSSHNWPTRTQQPRAAHASTLTALAVRRTLLSTQTRRRRGRRARCRRPPRRRRRSSKRRGATTAAAKALRRPSARAPGRATSWWAAPRAAEC
eukprot:scaffold1421_cov293-Prasinococcus_capsulatus_cf.AAC.2